MMLLFWLFLKKFECLRSHKSSKVTRDETRRAVNEVNNRHTGLFSSQKIKTKQNNQVSRFLVTGSCKKRGIFEKYHHFKSLESRDSRILSTW